MKDKVNYKIYDITTWKRNNRNTHTTQYLKKLRQTGNETWLVNIIHHQKYFLEKSFTKCARKTIPGAFLRKNKIERISGSIVYSLILLCQVEPIYTNHLLLPHIKLFLKTKRFGTSLLVSFSV